jgi:hypothetical protein
VVAVTFAEDRRGRIPFAFLGALLLLSSSLYAVSLAPPQATEPVVDEVRTDAEVEARLALDAAIRDADRRAARAPVLERSESGLGSILPASNTTVAALELRIAGAARRALENASAGRDGVRATVSLPPITDRNSARAALENVSIDHVADDRYRVRIKGLRVEITRHGRPVDRARYNVTVTTALPSLALHERTNRYERRVNAGVADPGLSRDLTARLFPIVWMRGYAQYGGAPIKNVLANRHVEVMTNDALLAQQAAVFGTADPAGRRATTRAAADVATRDLFRGAEETVKAHLGSRQSEPTGAGEPSGSPNVPIPGVVGTEQSVDANHTVDETYLEYVEGRDGPSLDDTVEEVYRGEVHLDRDATRVDTERHSFGSRPENGTSVYVDTATDRWHGGGEWTDGSGSTLRRYRGRVIEETVRTHYWVVNGTVTTTESLVRRTHRVSLELEGRYRPPGIAPSRPEGTMSFGPTARSRLAEAGTEAILGGGGVDDQALAAVAGAGNSRWRTVDIDPPAAVRERTERRTAALREATRGISVTVETRSMASSANPATALAAAIEAEREPLLDTPARYDTVADRAVAAARVTYLERVTAALRSKTSLVHRAQNALSDQLSDRMIPSSAPERSTPSQDSYVSSVEGGPTYLSAAPPDGSTPHLAARNVNLFTVPYGDAADAVSDRVGGTTEVSLRTAAQTLAVLDRNDGKADRDLAPLRGAVGDSVERATAAFRSELAPTLGAGTADRIVDAAAAEWETPAGRALAIVDGRFSRAIVAELPRGLSATDRDRLEVALRVAATDVRSQGSIAVSESLVERARADVTDGAGAMETESWKAAGTAAGTAAWERGTGESVDSLPAGLPLLPIPGSWYATANAWTVSVEGEYEHFAVGTRRAAPGPTPNGTVEYVREDAIVRTDVDSDGRPERLGRNRALSVAARTGVLIVVPPGGTGVGDVDGQAIETSPGW